MESEDTKQHTPLIRYWTVWKWSKVKGAPGRFDHLHELWQAGILSFTPKGSLASRKCMWIRWSEKSKKTNFQTFLEKPNRKKKDGYVV